jgi:hypothetical protein
MISRGEFGSGLPSMISGTYASFRVSVRLFLFMVWVVRLASMPPRRAVDDRINAMEAVTARSGGRCEEALEEVGGASDAGVRCGGVEARAKGASVGETRWERRRKGLI